jgi:hypothetical protein
MQHIDGFLATVPRSLARCEAWLASSRTAGSSGARTQTEIGTQGRNRDKERNKGGKGEKIRNEKQKNEMNK